MAAMKSFCNRRPLGAAAWPAGPKRVAGTLRCEPAARRLAARATAAQGENTPTATEVAPATLYQRLGGEARLEGIIENFYGKVYADDRLTQWFDGFEAKSMQRNMGRFLKFAFGEEPAYEGRDMMTAHAKLVDRGMSDVDYDVVVELLVAAFVESDVPADLMAEVGAIVESVRDPVLGRNPEDGPAGNDQ